jgi:hypothetical protein
MAKARLYVWNGREPKKELRGQAAIVLDVLKAQNGEPRLISDLTAAVNETGRLKTRQDPERVTGYYVVVFKTRGMVDAVEQEIDAENDAAETAETESLELEG